MKTLPTDREILKCIFEMYEPSYPGVPLGETRGKNDPYMPIDLRAVAAKLDCKPEMLFGRLYYQLDAKYRYTQDNGAHVHLFQLPGTSDRHSVNFPYLAAVLSEKDVEHRRQLWALLAAFAALVLSVASIIAQVMTAK
jgi:hypothetical protein